MLDWKLPLFPPDGSAVTVTVTVWIGVCMVVMFNLRFGWTLSGLVVPGYLVPLLLTQPVSVAIIVAESIVTYLLVSALSEGCPRFPYWSSFFGRDRFFALVLFSVLVRAVADGWLLPRLGQWLNATYQLDIDYRNDLHSYGLIIVALMANCFWKPGLARGLFMLTVTAGLTYLLVRFGLMVGTNFSLGSLRLPVRRHLLIPVGQPQGLCDHHHDGVPGVLVQPALQLGFQRDPDPGSVGAALA